MLWTELTANIVENRVREATKGERFAITLLFTPGHLEKLSAEDWKNLESHGFPVHLFPERDSRAGGNILSRLLRRLMLLSLSEEVTFQVTKTSVPILSQADVSGAGGIVHCAIDNPKKDPGPYTGLRPFTGFQFGPLSPAYGVS